MYGYGALTINSPTVATWNMYRNVQGKTLGQTTVESLLICNTFNTGSAVCPYTIIPVNTKLFTYPLVQVRQFHIRSI